MVRFEDLPNELILMIFSYFNQLELSQSFLQLNRRLTILLIESLDSLSLSSKCSQKKFHEILRFSFPTIGEFLSSLTIDHHQIGNDFLQHFKQIESLQLIDRAIDLMEILLERHRPQRLILVQTPFYQQTKEYRIVSSSLKSLTIDLQIEGFLENCLLTQLDLSLSSVLVDVRLSFSKLSSYFQLWNCLQSLRIEKMSLAIFSIDQNEFFNGRKISLTNLKDFQLEICSIPFEYLENLLPVTSSGSLRRFAFTGRTTKIDGQSWKIFLNFYRSIDRLDLKFFQCQSMNFDDFHQWERNFPRYFFSWNSKKNLWKISSSQFDRLERILINESIDDLDHIDYSHRISHLILRSQFSSSYFDLPEKIHQNLLQGFVNVRRLSISYRQLKDFLKRNFLHRIEQLDLEFAERFCFIDKEIAEEFPQLKSLHLSSMYDGPHHLNLHSTIKSILTEQFSHVNFLSIDSIRIVDENFIEETIQQWFSSRTFPPRISYQAENLFSVWF